jgi:hypothetical protein
MEPAMNHRTLLRSALLGAAALTTSAAMAQQPSGANVDTPRVDQRQAQQQQRIDQGVESGALTSREAARLERRQTQFEHREAGVEADGAVTPRERAGLAREQHRDSRAIHRQKHDRQQRS